MPYSMASATINVTTPNAKVNSKCDTNAMHSNDRLHTTPKHLGIRRDTSGKIV